MQPISLSELGILPPPFEWIYIPAGSVMLVYPPYHREPYVKASVGAFYISKYLITNQQYTVYEQETGHKQKHGSWRKEQFKHDYQPVIDILWTEAVLFCKWLTEKSRYKITLPADAQWHRAAQGDDNRKYPWGNEWDASYCNTMEAGIGHTTDVTQYPQGASPYGVLDMLGNVFQWCSTNAATGSNTIDFDTIENATEEYLWNEDRVFRGACYGSPAKHKGLNNTGAVQIFYSYETGIRLAYNID